MLATKFSQHIRDAAAQVLLQVLNNSKAVNGLHLRVEGDIFRYEDIFQIEKSYAKALSDLAFERENPIYFATGIFAKGGNVTVKNQVTFKLSCHP